MSHRKSKPSDPVMKYGRPIAYDREIFIGICQRLIGGQDLGEICSERGMPIAPMFLAWVQDHKEAREIYHSSQNFRSDRILAKKLDVSLAVSNNEWEEDVRANLERGWPADWIDRKYIPPDWSKVFPLIGSPPVGSTEGMQAYSDLLDAFTRMLQPRDEMELIWIKEAADAAWELQASAPLHHSRAVRGTRHHRDPDLARSRAIKRRDNALHQIARWRKGLGATARRLPDHLLLEHLLARRYGAEQLLAEAQVEASACQAMEAAAPLAPTSKSAQAPPPPAPTAGAGVAGGGAPGVASDAAQAAPPPAPPGEAAEPAPPPIPPGEAVEAAHPLNNMGIAAVAAEPRAPAGAAAEAATPARAFPQRGSRKLVPRFISSPALRSNSLKKVDLNPVTCGEN
jgi:hypothetical protein